MGNIPKSFDEVLRECEGGQLADELSAAVRKVVHAVMETAKPGTVSLSLKFVPSGRGTLKVSADFSAKEPKPDREHTTFFVGKDMDLLREDPAQERLPLRQPDKPAAEVRQPDYGANAASRNVVPIAGTPGAK